MPIYSHEFDVQLEWFLLGEVCTCRLKTRTISQMSLSLLKTRAKADAIWFSLGLKKKAPIS